ncbi:MAG: membrane protein insertase YidC [Planctomycetia bacterium]|nr:membrane protein insertase YidC [Planctomycetia bacterium]
MSGHSTVERRLTQFLFLSLAILLAGQLIQGRLFPKPARPPAAQPAADAEGAAPPSAENPPAAGETAGAAVEQVVADAVAAPTTVAPRTITTLGSLDPEHPARMLVTFNSLGGTIERIELSGRGYHDQDDRGGYLGHLALTAAEGGCLVGVVGPGTPAAAAGLRSGDVLTALDGTPVGDPAAVVKALAASAPGHSARVAWLRDGAAREATVTLDRRPLEVVRPERDALPALDAAVCDPLSFRLSLESFSGRSRPEPGAEIAGLEIGGRDWRLEPAATPDTVRFTTTLTDGTTIAKEYALVAEAPRDYALQLRVEIVAGDQPARIAYALDGPTGLPTEGWWYASRIARDWGALAVRDVALRFSGEPTALVSGLKIADNSLDHPASAVPDGKPLAYAGVDALYFAAALLPQPDGPEAPALAEVRPLAVGARLPAARKKLVNVTPRLVSRRADLEPRGRLAHRYRVFAGPKKPDLLAQFGPPGGRMDDLVYYGWFGWVARPMIAILHAIYAVVGNYGIAILLLTVLVRGGMLPVSRRQALSAQKMQALQPEMKAIAEKYKDDAEKRTRATQELWRAHGYNPASGCLPVFIQIPVLMGLYRSLATDVELRQAPLFSEAIRWCSNLAAPDMFWDWSRLLPPFLVAPEGWLGPFLNLFPLVTIGLFLWQQQLFMPPAVDEQSEMQQQVMKYMTFFMALMFFKVPCGLCLYFIASTLWGIGERLLLPTTLPAGAAASPATPSPARTPAAAAERVPATRAEQPGWFAALRRAFDSAVAAADHKPAGRPGPGAGRAPEGNGAETGAGQRRRQTRKKR